MIDRAKLQVDTLLKILLVLIIILLAVEVLHVATDIVHELTSSIVGLAILLVIVLWLLDAI